MGYGGIRLGFRGRAIGRLSAFPAGHEMLTDSELFAILLLCYFVIRSLRVDARWAFLQTAIYARRIGALVQG